MTRHRCAGAHSRHGQAVAQAQRATVQACSCADAQARTRARETQAHRRKAQAVGQTDVVQTAMESKPPQASAAEIKFPQLPKPCPPEVEATDGRASQVVRQLGSEAARQRGSQASLQPVKKLAEQAAGQQAAESRPSRPCSC